MSITISRSRSVNGNRSTAFRRTGVRAPPHCSASASALADHARDLAGALRWNAVGTLRRIAISRAGYAGRLFDALLRMPVVVMRRLRERLTVGGTHPALGLHLGAWCREHGHRADTGSADSPSPGGASGLPQST